MAYKLRYKIPSLNDMSGDLYANENFLQQLAHDGFITEADYLAYQREAQGKGPARIRDFLQEQLATFERLYDSFFEDFFIKEPAQQVQVLQRIEKNLRNLHLLKGSIN